jgi:hypothetical protein
MGRINAVDLPPERRTTLRRILVLPHREPTGGTAAAPGPPFLVAGNAGIQHIDILNTHRIAGSHHGGDIVRISDILQHNHQILLPFVQHSPYS